MRFDIHSERLRVTCRGGSYVAQLSSSLDAHGGAVRRHFWHRDRRDGKRVLLGHDLLRLPEVWPAHERRYELAHLQQGPHGGQLALPRSGRSTRCPGHPGRSGHTGRPGACRPGLQHVYLASRSQPELQRVQPLERHLELCGSGGARRVVQRRAAQVRVRESRIVEAGGVQHSDGLVSTSEVRATKRGAGEHGTCEVRAQCSEVVRSAPWPR